LAEHILRGEKPGSVLGEHYSITASSAASSTDTLYLFDRYIVYSSSISLWTLRSRSVRISRSACFSLALLSGDGIGITRLTMAIRNLPLSAGYACVAFPAGCRNASSTMAGGRVYWPAVRVLRFMVTLPA